MVHDERDHHAEESQTKKGSGIKFGGGRGREELSEGKARHARVEAGKGPPPPRYAQIGGDEGHHQDVMGW